VGAGLSRVGGWRWWCGLNASVSARGGGDGMKHCRKMKWRQRSRLGLWEGSVTRRGIMAMSVGGEVAPGRGKGGNDSSWTDANLTGSKNEENSRGRSSYYK
jgi:hypothetical protein